MDGIHGVTTPRTVQGSNQENRAQAGIRRRAESTGGTATDRVDVAARPQAESAPSVSRPEIGDEPTARSTAQAAKDQILAMPMVAALAQANSSADAVLNMLR